jgi:hypothetical protein
MARKSTSHEPQSRSIACLTDKGCSQRAGRQEVGLSHCRRIEGCGMGLKVLHDEFTFRKEILDQSKPYEKSLFQIIL